MLMNAKNANPAQNCPMKTAQVLDHTAGVHEKLLHVHEKLLPWREVNCCVEQRCMKECVLVHTWGSRSLVFTHTLGYNYLCVCVCVLQRESSITKPHKD